MLQEHKFKLPRYPVGLGITYHQLEYNNRFYVILRSNECHRTNRQNDYTMFYYQKLYLNHKVITGGNTILLRGNSISKYSEFPKIPCITNNTYIQILPYN